MARNYEELFDGGLLEKTSGTVNFESSPSSQITISGQHAQDTDENKSLGHSVVWTTELVRLQNFGRVTGTELAEWPNKYHHRLYRYQSGFKYTGARPLDLGLRTTLV